MLTQIERDRMAARWFPYQLTIQSEDGTYSTHGGYTSKAQAVRAGSDIFKFDNYNKRPIRLLIHNNETGRLIINKKRKAN